MYLSIPLADLPIRASSAVALAERIAAEYGLAACAQTDDQSLEVWLSRMPPQPERSSSPSPRLAEASTIPLPKLSGKPATPEGKSYEGRSPAKPETGGILIADEETGLRQLIAERLARHGLCVREARTGQETLGAIQELRPDLLLLDINLPDRSGWDVLRELRQRGVAVPTIVVAAGRVAPCRLEEFRPIAYLPKPYPLEALLRLVVDYERSRRHLHLENEG